jgi:hypothetical protein
LPDARPPFTVAALIPLDPLIDVGLRMPIVRRVRMAVIVIVIVVMMRMVLSFFVILRHSTALSSL